MIQIGDRRLELKDFEKLLFEKSSVSLNKVTLDKVAICHEFLKDFG